MNERLTTSIVLYGEIDSSDSKKWLDFYNYIVDFTTSYNLTPNYMGASAVSIKSCKISPIKRIEKKLYTSIENNEEITSVSLYNLPDEFEIAAFDYNAYICRTNRLTPPHILVTFLNEVFDEVDHTKLTEDMKDFINFEHGEIFKLSNLESPHIYASRANNPSTFKTLEVICKF